jgi:hypothetical protein
MNQIATFIIGEDGNLTFLVTEGTTEMFPDVPACRASHVEPSNFVFRTLFHFLRQIFGDKGRVSDWTRAWPVIWRVNTKPTAGVILPERWPNRQDAIDAEIEFLNGWFLRRNP